MVARTGDGGRGRWARRFGALAAVAVLASGLVAGASTSTTAAPDAAAAASSGKVGAVNILMDKPGTTARYGPNEVVTIEAGNINFVGNCETAADGGKPGRQKKGLKDWFQPWADLYVIPSGLEPVNNETLSDVGGSPNSVFGSISGTFLYEPLGLTFPTGKLPAGVYAIVVDECQNGVFDTGEDSYLEDVFWVDTDDDVPPLSAQAQGFLRAKQAAARNAFAFGAVERLLKLREAYELLDKAAKVGAASMGAEQAVVFLIGWGAEYLKNDSPYGQLQERAKDIAKQTVEQVSARYARLADDPPDTSYQRYAIPSTGRPIFVESGEAFDAGWTAYLAELDVLSGLVGAILDAAERYQGADVAGNGAWARRHARELQVLLAEYRDRLPAFQAAGDQLEEALRDRYGLSAFRFADGIRDLAAVPDRVNDPDAERSAAVRNSGVDLDAARAIATDFDATIPKPTADGLDDWLAILDDAEASVLAFGDATTGLGDQAADLEDQLVAGVPTIVDDPTGQIELTGTPSAGTTVQLRLAGAVAGDNVRWDLDGDGATDDALGIEVPWTVPANAEVGVPLLITAELVRGAQQAVAIEVVEVAAGGNRGPAVSPVDQTLRTVLPGASTTLEVTASDPDGDPLEYTWTVDGVPVPGATGPTFTYSAPADGLGGRLVRVWVTDGKAVRTNPWLVTISPPDADGDGFRASPGPDCDDASSAVSPIDAEVVGNGIDDDCDPESPDDGSKVLGSISIGTLDNQARTGGEVLTAARVVSWTHPQRFQDVPFRLTVDWGDGTVDTYIRQGTTRAQTDFPILSHQYRKEQIPVQFSACIEVVDTGARFCARYANTIVNNRPLVNGADLRTWGPSEHLVAPDASLGRNGSWYPIDPDGRMASTDQNSDEPIILPSSEELPGGYGRAALSHQVLSGGDDDFIGLVLGYQPGEINDPNADYVGVSWVDTDQDGFTARCNDRTGPSLRWAPDFTAWRVKGTPLAQEFFTLSTFAYPYDPSDDAATGEDPQWSGCDDDQGVTRLGVVPKNDPRYGGERWLFRASDATQRQRAGLKPQLGASYSLDPYLVEYDYQPDRLQIWVNGELQLDVAPQDPATPFPPGGIGLYMQSLIGIRAAATAPEPTFSFVQGKGGPVSGGDPDGISMPMHDDPDDEHTAIIEWGDGEPATPATVVDDPATGAGWWKLEGDHVYERTGTFRGKACATDGAGLSSCFPFTAVVAAAPPVVDAGPDRSVNAEVLLDDMTFQDPGPFDAHTATIDWGDGSDPEPATVLAARGGGSVTATHTYADDGTYPVELCVTDQDGATACDARELEVLATPVPPVARVSESLVVPEGSPADVGVGFTDANPDDPHTATIDWGDGAGPQPVALQDGGAFGSATATTRYPDDGTFDVTVQVCDLEACDTAAATVTVTNAVPLVDGRATLDLSTATLEAEVVDPGIDDTHTATVDWGDGGAPEAVDVTAGPDGSTIAASHRYLAIGAYVVEVCATDDDGDTGCDLIDVTVEAVSGRAPTVAVDDGATGVEGAEVALSGTIDDADEGDLADVSIEVDPGDGSGAVAAIVDVGAGTWTAGHTYADDGPYAVSVTACDASSLCADAEGEAVIGNGAPLVDAGRDRASGRSAVLEDVTYADPGTADEHTATVDWGDGSGPEVATVVGAGGAGTVQDDHAYAADGTYTVEVCVTDDDGGTACDAFELEVATPPIAVVVPAVATVVEGSPLEVAFSFADPEGGAHTATIRWGDGSPASDVALTEGPDGDATVGSGSASHAYADDGVRAATIEVCDEGGRCGSASVSVTTTNAPPAASTPELVGGAGTASVQLLFTDPGALDTHTATVDWGDGGDPAPASVDAGTRTVTADHEYAAGGTYAVEVCVADDDGGESCIDAEVEVADPPTEPPTLALDPPDGVDEGGTVALTGTIVDADSGSFAYAVDWGDGSTASGTTGSALALEHAYVDEGRYTITVEVDDGTAVDTDAVQVDVGNAAPSVELDPSVAGLAATVIAEVTDPGDDELTLTIDWGDGTVDTLPAASRRAARATFTADHAYQRAGTWSVEVCARDGDGGRTCAAAELVAVDATTTTTTTTTTSTSVPATTTTSSGGGSTTTTAGGGGGGGGAGGGGAVDDGSVGDGTLPRTGSDPRPDLWLGGLLLLGGGLLLLARRRFAARS